MTKQIFDDIVFSDQVGKAQQGNSPTAVTSLLAFLSAATTILTMLRTAQLASNPGPKCSGVSSFVGVYTLTHLPLIRVDAPVTGNSVSSQELSTPTPM